MKPKAQFIVFHQNHTFTLHKAWLSNYTDKTSLIQQLWQNCENDGEKADGLKSIDLKTAFLQGFL